MKLAVLAAMLICSLGLTPARAEVFSCSIGGSAGSYQIKKISIDFQRGINFKLNMKWDWAVFSTSGTHYHFFAGFYLVRASDFALWSYSFLDYTQVMSPPTGNITLQGEEIAAATLPTTGEFANDAQGKTAIAHYIDPDDYYLIGFADGSGSYDLTMFVDRFDPGCTDVDVPGKIVSLNADSFKGGTQVRAPGYGTAQGASAAWTTQFARTLGALYSYEPNPFSPGILRLETDAYGSETFSNKITQINSYARRWEGTVSYQGRADTVLLELLNIDLGPTK